MTERCGWTVSFNVLKGGNTGHKKTQLGSYTAAHASFLIPRNTPGDWGHKGARVESSGPLGGVSFAILTQFLYSSGPAYCLQVLASCLPIQYIQIIANNLNTFPNAP